MEQQIPLKIERKPLQFFVITMNNPFPIGSHALVSAKTTFITGEDVGDGDSRNILVDYHYKISSMADDFEFSIQLVRPFTLSPLGKITAQGVYRCATICKDEVQEYMAKLFADYKPPPEPKVEAFEELEPEILRMIESFY